MIDRAEFDSYVALYGLADLTPDHRRECVMCSTWQKGRDARDEGAKLADSPLIDPRQDVLHTAWMFGWHHRDSEITVQ